MDDPEVLLETFCAGRVCSPAPPAPGVMTVEVDGRAVVPVFRSAADLAAAFGSACRYFSTTGLDLLDLLPEGVLVGLDPLGPEPLLLDPAAVRLERTLVLRAAS